MAKTKQDNRELDETGLTRQGKLYTSVFPCWRNLHHHGAGNCVQACSLDQSACKAFKRKEPAWKSTQPYPSYTYSYRRTCCVLPPQWKAGLSSIERNRDGVTVVVVGVTSHRGAWESHAQGKGSQTMSFKQMDTNGGDRPYV